MPPEDQHFPVSSSSASGPSIPSGVPSAVPQPVAPGATALSAALPASFLRRLGNSLIDGIAIGVISYPLLFVVSLMLRVSQDAAARSFDVSALVAYGSLSMIVPVFYFLICESVWGKTIGKLATGTKVVDYTGLKPSFGRVFLRTICRFIPFDNISFLFRSYPRGWHDKISGTLVVLDEVAPAAVVGMDRGATGKAKGPHRWAVMLISILGVLQLLAIPFFLFLTALLFINGFSEGGSPSQSRSEGNEAYVRSSVFQIAVTAELYRDANASYAGFCTDKGQYGAAEVIERQASAGIDCRDSAEAWVVTAPLEEGDICADSEGTFGYAPRPLEEGEVSCPEGTETR